MSNDIFKLEANRSTVAFPIINFSIFGEGKLNKISTLLCHGRLY